MDKKYYDIIKKLHNEIHLDPKVDPNVRANVQEMLRFKKTPIMSWYLVYLRGVCDARGWEDMKDYVPVEKVDDIFIHYAVTPNEAFTLVGSTNPAYYNKYDIDDVKFIKGWIAASKMSGKSVLRVISYKKTIWLVQNQIPENFKVIPASEIDAEPIEENEKIGS